MKPQIKFTFSAHSFMIEQFGADIYEYKINRLSHYNGIKMSLYFNLVRNVNKTRITRVCLITSNQPLSE